MDNKLVSFSSTLYDCATECALRRLNKHCKHKFDSGACNNCSFYVKRYIDADPRHVELFMIQAGTRAYSLWRTTRESHTIFIGAIIVCLLLAVYYYKIENSYSIIDDRPHNTVTSKNISTGIKEDIFSTLKLVSKDMEKGVDVNSDGLSNCIDAAVKFYKYFPDKSKVCIEWNYNEITGMNHLFNCVFIDGVWRAIEPQAYYRNWGYENWYMRNIWGSKYDSSFNKDVTKDYIKFTK